MSAVTTNTETSRRIPETPTKPRALSDDLVECCILPRVPAKSLLRFQCVSVRWHNLISTDPHFKHVQSHSGFFSIEDRHVGRSYNRPPFVSRHPSLLNSLSFSNNSVGAREKIVASCNGVICFTSRRNNEERPMIFIGNPTLNEYIWLGFRLNFYDLPDQEPCFGLAVDVGDLAGVSYSLVAILRRNTIVSPNAGKSIYKYAILARDSSNSKKWERKFEISSYVSFIDKVSVYVKGSLYWKFGHRGTLRLNPRETHIDKAIGLAPLPESTNPEFGRIGEWNNRLSYVTVVSKEIEIWVMDHLHPCSWSKMHSINLEMVERREKLYGVQLMPFGNENVLSFVVEGTVYCYDLTTKSVNKIGEQDDPQKTYSWLPYKSSLVSIIAKTIEDM